MQAIRVQQERGEAKGHSPTPLSSTETEVALVHSPAHRQFLAELGRECADTPLQPAAPLLTRPTVSPLLSDHVNRDTLDFERIDNGGAGHGQAVAAEGGQGFLRAEAGDPGGPARQEGGVSQPSSVVAWLALRGQRRGVADGEEHVLQC